MTDAAIALDTLTHCYGGAQALDGVTLELPRAASIAFIGPDGVGINWQYKDGHVEHEKSIRKVREARDAEVEAARAAQAQAEAERDEAVRARDAAVKARKKAVA